MNIKIAQQAQLDAVMDMTRNCVAHLRAGGLDQWDEIYPSRKVFERDIEMRALYLAMENNSILGTIVLNDYQDEEYADVPWHQAGERVGVIHRLMVQPDAEGQGVAHQLLLFAEEQAKDAGHACIRLDAFSQNARALRFYEQHGYVFCGTVHFRKGIFRCYDKEL